MRNILIVLPFFLITGCADDIPTSNQKEAMTVEQQQKLYNNGQPPPVFDWSLQRQMFIDYYKSLNETCATWSVVMDHGEPKFITPSIGEPIPVGTQLTNPMSHEFAGVALPQAEPNGLYSPNSSRGTIIMATNDDGTVTPIYSEPDVLCFPFPVRWNPETKMLERIPGQKASMSISIKKPPKPVETVPAK